MKISNFMLGKRRYVAAAMVAATLGSGAYAFAASLNVTTNTLGSGSATVGNNCALTTSYTASYSNNTYDLHTIAVKGTGTDCATAGYRVTVSNSAGASLEEWNGTLAADGTAILTAASTVDTAAIVAVTAVIENGSVTPVTP